MEEGTIYSVIYPILGFNHIIPIYPYHSLIHNISVNIWDVSIIPNIPCIVHYLSSFETKGYPKGKKLSSCALLHDFR